MNASFPKRFKLRKRSDFLRVAKEGKRLYGHALRVDCLKTSSPDVRMGITASRRFGDAVERNRFKRLAREAFRTARSEIPTGIEINIIPLKNAKNLSFSEMRSELITLLSRC